MHPLNDFPKLKILTVVHGLPIRLSVWACVAPPHLGDGLVLSSGSSNKLSIWSHLPSTLFP